MEKRIVKGMAVLLIVSVLEAYFEIASFEYAGIMHVVFCFWEAALICFLILMFGYMYGSGAGCVIGTIAGLVMLVKSGDVTYMGVFCLTGGMAGFFNSLGKVASVMGYYACLWILALLYVPFILEVNWICGLLIAGMAFMLLPIKLSKERIRDREYNSFEGKLKYSRRRVSEVADAFRRLSENVIRVNKEEDGIFATGLQLREAAGILDRISDSMFIDYIDKGREEEKNIKEALERKGYLVENLRLLKGERGEIKIEVLLCRQRGTEKVKEAAALISAILGKNVKAADTCRTIVSREVSEYIFVEEPAFMMLHAAVSRAKDGEEVSGDNFTCMELENGELLLGIVDGMGSGVIAGEESELVIEILEDLIRAGFDEESALSLVNSMLIARSGERSLAAVDMAVGDLYTGRFSFVKLGAAATFIKRNKWVEILKSTNYPIGVLKEVDYENVVKKLYDNDYIIMVSDGVLDAVRGENKEEILSGWIADFDKKNPNEFARYILERALSESEDEAKDDMTVLVAGIWAKKA